MELRVEHVGFVARSLARFGVRAADIEDLTQEVLIVAMRRSQSFDSSRRAEPWLFGIARNVTRDFWRLARHKIEKVDSTTVPDIADSANTPEATVEARQRAQYLRTAIAALDDNLQELIVLHDLEEIPMNEVAAALDLKIDTAYARLRRGRQELRRTLSNNGAVDATE